MVFLRWEIFTSNHGFFFHTKFHTKLRDSKHLLSDTLLYVFPVKNISNVTSRFPILYSTKMCNKIDLFCMIVAQDTARWLLAT